MKEDCIFCKIASGQIPVEKVYEDDSIFAFLDQRPKAPGHTLVIPKIHSDNLLETSDEILAYMMPKIKMIAQKVLDQNHATGFNLSVNNGASAGQEVMHLHFHIIPRK